MEEKDFEVVENAVEESEVVETTPLTNDEYEEVVEETIPSLEDKKKAFNKAYNSSRVVSYISSAIVFAIVIVAYVVIFPLEPNGTWAGIILIILTLVASTMFSRWHRKKITDKVRQYMADYNDEVNRIAFADSEVTNYVFDFAGRIEKEPFTEARFLKDIVNTDSRNFLRYELGDWKVEYADYVAYRPDGKRAKSAFYGKFLNATREASIDGRIVVYVKPDPTIFKDTVGPDDLDDLVLVDDDPRYKLYATNKELKKKVCKAALEALLAIRPNNNLADVTVILYENKLAATFTYSDAILIVPYKEVINSGAIREHAANVTAFNKFLSLLK